MSKDYRQTDNRPRARVTPCGFRRLDITANILRVQILKSDAYKHTEKAAVLGCDSVGGCLPMFRRNLLPSCSPEALNKTAK